MSEVAQRTRTEPVARRFPSTRAAALLGLAAAIIVLCGGYSQHWSWTGINGKTATLWDWLHLLMLPVAVGILPLLLSRRAEMKPRHKLLGAGVLALLAVVVVAGYAVPWHWSGFAGNKLWDWLELVALPLAIAISPTIADLRRGWNTRHTLIAVAAALAFAVIVMGGYEGHWSWTGFRGNTLWNWLQLLLLPLLIPTLVVPALEPMAAAHLAPTGAEDDRGGDDDPSREVNSPRRDDASR